MKKVLTREPFCRVGHGLSRGGAWEDQGQKKLAFRFFKGYDLLSMADRFDWKGAARLLEFYAAPNVIREALLTIEVQRLKGGVKRNRKAALRWVTNRAQKPEVIDLGYIGGIDATALLTAKGEKA